MAAIESLGKQCEKAREELTAYYKSLYDKDLTEIEAKARELYPDNEEFRQIFMEGYRYSIQQPLTRSIHLIVMYVCDYIPRNGLNLKYVVTQIREIFRGKLCPVVNGNL